MFTSKLKKKLNYEFKKMHIYITMKITSKCTWFFAIKSAVMKAIIPVLQLSILIYFMANCNFPSLPAMIILNSMQNI